MLRGGLAGVAITVALAFVPAANASTFTVDTKKDLLDANQVDGVCAAANGKCSVRAATMAANGHPGLDDIQIPAGTYELTREPSDTLSSLEGDLDLDEAVVITGAGSGETIIRQTMDDRVILSNAEPAGILPGALITGLTITGGRITEPGNQLGGGVRVDTNFLGIDDVTVRDNKVLRTVGNSFGGGIAVTDTATIVIQYSKVTENAVKLRSETAGAVGGGIYVDASSTGSTITDTKVTKNVATVKGGGFGTGGGVFARSPISIQRADISENRAQEGGGLTLTQSLESASILDTTISRNLALEGAGINISTLDPVAMTNVTISENRLATGHPRGGGAMHSNLGDITMSHVTIAENHSSTKRAIVVKPVVAGAVQIDLTGSIIAGPHKDCRGFNEDVIRDQNIFSDNSCAPPLFSTNQVTHPILKPLANNPGAFSENFYPPTHALMAASPAIDFVTSGCPPPAQDQLGFPRPAGSNCDAGAVERQP
jgi:hypothetical protein